MDTETRARIKHGLATWNDPDSEARKRFELCVKEWDERLRPYQEAIKRSMIITAEDLQKVINI